MAVRLHEVGLNRLTWRLLLMHGGLLVPTIVIFGFNDMAMAWTPARVVTYGIIALVLGLWGHVAMTARTPGDRHIAEVLFIVFLVLLFTNIGSAVQYAAVALRMPLADAWLARVDASLGFHVPSMARWIETHPPAALLMRVSYASLLVQFVTSIALLTLFRERERLWEFVFHFHVCVAVALVAFAVWPAACTNVYYGFAPTIDQDLVVSQIRAVRDGTLRTIRVEDVQGLISFPSVHAAGGLIVTWAFRGYVWIQIALVVINAAMILSTFVTGVHYVVDTIAAFPLFGLSLATYRWWGRPLLGPGDAWLLRR